MGLWTRVEPYKLSLLSIFGLKPIVVAGCFMSRANFIVVTIKRLRKSRNGNDTKLVHLLASDSKFGHWTRKGLCKNHAILFFFVKVINCHEKFAFMQNINGGVDRRMEIGN